MYHISLDYKFYRSDYCHILYGWFSHRDYETNHNYLAAQVILRLYIEAKQIQLSFQSLICDIQIDSLIIFTNSILPITDR